MNPFEGMVIVLGIVSAACIVCAILAALAGGPPYHPGNMFDE